MWAPGAVRLACIEQLIVFELCAVWCGLYVDSTACFFFLKIRSMLCIGH